MMEVSPKDYAIGHSRVKKGMVDHFVG